ncbi:MAG: pantothenate kinase, partial [Acidobacteriota bacterium]|nr:pantothenate kinase [Acidobacteriota bacterium]
RVVGTHTVAAMQSGLVHGWTGMVREMVRLLKEELGGKHTVIATGGLAQQVADWTGVVDLVNERLTLEGVRIVVSRDAAAPA